MTSDATQASRATSLRALWQRRRRVVLPAAAALLVIGAFLAWGPIGLGNGPLSAQIDPAQGFVDEGHALVAFTVPLSYPGGGMAVIDAVVLVGGTTYPDPRTLGLGVLTNGSCGGVWPARAAGRAFVIAGCGGPYHGALIGHAISRPYTTWPGFPAAAEVAAPRPGTCWVLTKIGIRHYAATYPYELADCARDASGQLTAAMNAAGA
jgi:hypothetical protein